MAHLMKNTKVNCPNLIRHFERNEDIKNYSNEKIDLSKTHLNYNLAPERTQGQFEFIKERCNEVKCLNRSDVKVMANWVITLPKDVKENEEELFFKETYNFLKERYGGVNEENVISAYIHKDETTPHMHFAFVPVAYDKNKEIYKVSAKEVLTRNDLRSFHSDLDKHIQLALGREVGILNGITRDGNLSTNELKRGDKAQEYVKLTEDIESAKKELKALKDVVEDKNSTIEELQKEIQKLKIEKEVDQNIIKAYTDVPKGKKTLGGSIKLSQKEYDNLVEKNKAYLNEHKENQNLKASQKYYNDSINSLEYKNSENQKSLKELRLENKKLSRAVTKEGKKINLLVNAIQQINQPKNLTEEGRKAVNSTLKDTQTKLNNINKPTLQQQSSNINME